VDRDKIHDIARFAAVGGGSGFVGGEVDGMQHIAKQLVTLRGEEAKIAVSDPFELHGFAKSLNACLAFACLNFPPGYFQTRRGECGAVGFGSGSHALFGILKDVGAALLALAGPRSAI